MVVDSRSTFDRYVLTLGCLDAMKSGSWDHSREIGPCWAHFAD